MIETEMKKKGVRESPNISSSSLVTSPVLTIIYFTLALQSTSMGQQQILRICILPRSKGEVYAHSILKNTVPDHSVVEGHAEGEKMETLKQH